MQGASSPAVVLDHLDHLAAAERSKDTAQPLLQGLPDNKRTAGSSWPMRTRGGASAGLT